MPELEGGDLGAGRASVHVVAIQTVLPPEPFVGSVGAFAHFLQLLLVVKVI